MESVVSATIGIFEILYECNYKSNDGHKVFHIRCTKCGWETDRQLRHIEITKECHHVGIDSSHIKYGYEFENKKIRHIFHGMKNRCYNQNSKDFSQYGEKGIKICNEWLENPKSFEEWSLSNGYEDNLTIDRIDSNKDYSPDNCRWITSEDNSKWKSTTNYIEVDGILDSGRGWSKRLGLSVNYINKYLRKNGLEKTICFIKKF